MNAVALVVTGLDLPLLGFGPTPLRMLLTLVVLTAVVLTLVALGTVLASRPIDRQWPPDEPLDPTEMLWGEVGGYVQKSFSGLDLNLARDLASYMDEVKVGADSWIVQYGDPASHYYVLKKGEAESLRAKWTDAIAEMARQVRDEPQPDPADIYNHIFAE